jgi:hypothetical protein
MGWCSHDDAWNVSACVLLPSCWTQYFAEAHEVRGFPSIPLTRGVCSHSHAPELLDGVLGAVLGTILMTSFDFIKSAVVSPITAVLFVMFLGRSVPMFAAYALRCLVHVQPPGISSVAALLCCGGRTSFAGVVAIEDNFFGAQVGARRVNEAQPKRLWKANFSALCAPVTVPRLTPCMCLL